MFQTNRVGGQFQDIVEPFAAGFSSAADFLDKIFFDGGIQLLLDATIDFSASLDLSTSSFNVSSELKELSSALYLRVEKEFTTSAGGLAVTISPLIELSLEANNTEVEFDVFADGGLSKLASFDFNGSFFARVAVSLEGVPAVVTIEAALDDLTNTSSLEFDVFVDM